MFLGSQSLCSASVSAAFSTEYASGLNAAQFTLSGQPLSTTAAVTSGFSAVRRIPASDDEHIMLAHTQCEQIIAPDRIVTVEAS